MKGYAKTDDTKLIACLGFSTNEERESQEKEQLEELESLKNSQTSSDSDRSGFSYTSSELDQIRADLTLE